MFDNSDPSQSPVGYEQFKQITVTRQVFISSISSLYYKFIEEKSNIASALVCFFVVALDKHFVLDFYLCMYSLGCCWWKKQIFNQWTHCPCKPSAKFVSQCSIECKQPSFSDYAGIFYWTFLFALICSFVDITIKKRKEKKLSLSIAHPSHWNICRVCLISLASHLFGPLPKKKGSYYQSDQYETRRNSLDD